ncbi:MAG TPA: VCBS repeat-containing protein [Terriglobia bacterium]|nr:VCBS repeat-containing protein [Terriglobia bacterium]
MSRVRLVLVVFLFHAGTLPLLSQTTDTAIHLPPLYNTFQPPAVGNSYADPVFSTAIKRISDVTSHVDATNGKALNFISHEYSSMSPFNCDDSLLLLIYQSYFVLNDGNGNYIRALPFSINASSEPRWSRNDPSVLYFVNGNQLKQYNVSTDKITVIHTFAEYSKVSGKGESDLSEDGNHFVFAGDDRYVFVYELSTGMKSPVFDAGQAFDGLQISPNDNVTISWFTPGSARSQGIELFDRNMKFLRQIARADGHMDLARDTNGDEVMIWTNAADAQATCANAIVKVRLADASQTCLLSLPWSQAVHISAPDGNGWVFVSTYDPTNPDPSRRWDAYENEILQIRLDGGEVRRLLHHRSRPADTYNYEPRASVSRDGRKLVFASNYDLQSILGSIVNGLLGLVFALPTVYSDEYLIQLSGTADPFPTGPISGTMVAFSQTAGAGVSTRRTEDVTLVFIDGTGITAKGPIARGVDLTWLIAATADLDGDGKADIIWRNSQTGDVAAWLMDGATMKSWSTLFSRLGPSWFIAGIGDLDGDGKQDLIWQDRQTGDVSEWLMNGTSIKSWASLFSGANSNWTVAGVGDLDGDGKADLVWENPDSGDVVEWLMDGATTKSWATLATGLTGLGSPWQLSGVGDFDGDGNADLIWSNSSTGDVVAWLMKGATLKSWATVASGITLQWSLRSILDIDGDGKSDLLWQNRQSGALVEWLMNGTSIRGTKALSSSAP